MEEILVGGRTPDLHDDLVGHGAGDIGKRQWIRLFPCPYDLSQGFTGHQTN